MNQLDLSKTKKELEYILEDMKSIKQDIENKQIEIENTLSDIQESKKELSALLGYSGSLIKYGAVCYQQVSHALAHEGEFMIRYPYDSLPNNGLLFLAPKYSSIFENNKLILQYSYRKGTSTVTGTKTYKMFKETQEGTFSPVTTGDIVANRLAIFRFISNSSDSVILINNPQYNHLNISSLYVTNKITLGEIPRIISADGSYTSLSTEEDIIKLEDRLTALENKFLYGTDNADDVLYDKPEGTIYIKIEE